MHPLEWRPVAKGLLTMVPGLYRRVARARGGGTDSADYCYSVWMKHLTFLWESGMRSIPASVAELGPGESLGVGIAWLLSGASRFYGLDAVEYSNIATNLRMLDELVDRFRRRAPDSIAGWPDFHRLLGPTLFPGHILGDADLARTLAPARIEAIREAIRTQSASGEVIVRYLAGWTDSNSLPAASVDLIYSQSVLEHVVDVPMTYASCAKWLRPAGWMSHQIDFTSHSVTRAWNGHWQYPEWLWKVVVGGRPYLINRYPAAAHVQMMEAAGFRLALQLRDDRADGMPRARLAAPYRSLPDSELTCSSMFIQARKPTER